MVRESNGTMRDKMKKKLAELREVSDKFGISHSITIGYIVDDIEKIIGIQDDSWMGVPWTEFLTCEQEAEVLEGRKAIEELKQLRSKTAEHDKQVREKVLDEWKTQISFCPYDRCVAVYRLLRQGDKIC